VTLAPSPARDLGVGDVAHECVPEPILRLTLDRREARASQKLPALELTEIAVHSSSRQAADRGESARPDDLSDDGGVLEEGFALVGERVEAGRNKALDRLGDREPLISDSAKAPVGALEQPAVLEHPDELHSEEGITGRGADDGLRGLARDRLARQLRDELAGLVL
jgi:hypothetical protein